MMFCPYCGAKQEEQPRTPEEKGKAEAPADRNLKERRENPEVAKLLEEALAVTSLKDREKKLMKARRAFPDSLAIEWELLFIGHPRKPPRGKIDFSIIKCYLLEIYRNPKDFTPERAEEMRREIFDDPQLRRVQELSGDPEQALEAYVQRLCLDYIEIFLEGDNRISGSLFGFRLERNLSKMLARPVAGMIGAIRQDQALTPEQQSLLTHGLYRGYEQRAGGTARLDEALAESEE